MQRFKRYLIETYGAYTAGNASAQPVQIPITGKPCGKFDVDRLQGRALARMLHANYLEDAATLRYERQYGGHYSLVIEHQHCVDRARRIRLYDMCVPGGKTAGLTP